MSNTLSIFVDESGDYGKFGNELIASTIPFSDRFYIISFIFHNQDADIQEDLKRLNYIYSKHENDKHKYIHFGPLLRREDDFYKSFSTEEARSIMFVFSNFIRKTDIKCCTLILDKTKVNNIDQAKGYFKDLIDNLIENNINFFKKFNKINIYYDNGQTFVKEILNESFLYKFKNSIFKKIFPENYRLFQACDYLCTIKLIKIKRKNNITSKTEKAIFNNKKAFRGILNIIKEKSLD